MTKKSMILGYWDFRGFGEACRYMLEYCGCDYEENVFERKSSKDHNPWRNVKNNFGLDFPNIPYLIDGERRITESTAILKYLGRRYGLVPKTEDDMIRGDMLEGVILEMRTRFYDVFFCPNGEYKKYAKELQDWMVAKLTEISRFFGDRTWLVCDELTFHDFLFYTRLAQTTTLFPKCLDGLERLKKYMEDIEALPSIGRYKKSGRFVQFPDHDPYLRMENRVE